MSEFRRKWHSVLFSIQRKRDHTGITRALVMRLVKVKPEYSFKYAHFFSFYFFLHFFHTQTHIQGPSSSTYLDFTACRGGATFLLSIEVFWEQGPNKSSVEEEQTKADMNNYGRSGAQQRKGKSE